MSSVKYLLDEHVDPRFRRALKRYVSEMIVWCIGDVAAPALSTLDPEILLWCEENGFVLVTNNRASMPVHLQDHLATGRHIPGIFVLNTRMTMGETVDELALIWEASETEEYVDGIWYLPISR